MIEKKDLLQIKQHISNSIGSKVKLESNKRHNKSVINEGIILNVYPSIFTIKISGNNNPLRTVSYSYTDILTNSVELTLYDS